MFSNLFGIKILPYSVCLLLVITVELYSQENDLQENFDVKFYWLNLKISDTSTFIKANTIIDVELLKETDTILLNLGSQLNISGIQLNGFPVGYSHIDNELYIISDSLNVSDNARIEISYEGDGNDSLDNGALFLKENKYGTFVYSLTEPFATKYWYPCKEVLSDKADSAYVYVTVPNNRKAGSIGLLKEVIDVDENHKQFRWETKYPIAYYLISVAVGDYLDYTFQIVLNDSLQPMPVINYIYNSSEYLETNKEAIETTSDLLILYSDIFGLYPFYKEKYGHSVVPLGGGMEHQTMTTLGSFNFDLVAHELAHQWFGDYVTCKSWNDIWINEGFATYSEYLAREMLQNYERAAEWMNYTHGLIVSEDNGSIYVPDIEIGNSSRIFDYRLSYKKGAAIIHMIRYELNNDSLFFGILKKYLNKFKFKTASAEDFKLILEEFSNRSFTNFFNEWYYGEGYPIIKYGWAQKDDTLYITTNQSTSSPDKTPFFHLKMPFDIVFPAGDTLIEFNMVNKEQVFKVYIPYPVYEVNFDPKNNIVKKVWEYGASDSSDTDLTPVILFPNPTTGEVRIFSRSVREPVDLQVYNYIGHHIKTFKNVDPYGTTLSMNDFSKGIYFFKIKDGYSNSTIKIVKL